MGLHMKRGPISVAAVCTDGCKGGSVEWRRLIFRHNALCGPGRRRRRRKAVCLVNGELMTGPYGSP